MYLRNINALHLCQCTQDLITSSASAFFPLMQYPEQFRDRLLPVPDQEGVHERGHRHGIDRAWPPGNNQRISVFSVCRAERDPTQIEHIKHRGITKLVLETESYYIKSGNRPVEFQGTKGLTRGPQCVFHILPRMKNPLSGCKRKIVDYIVEYTQTKMGHTHVVNVRERQCDLQERLMAYNVDLMVYVAAGPLNFQ